jgi:hypothetical protein
MMAEDDDSTGNAPSNKKNDKKNSSTNNNNAGDNTEENEGILDKMKRMTNNCCAATGLCCFKFKEQSQISALEMKVIPRQKKFGVDYLTLVERHASPKELKNCLKEALNDIAVLQGQINDHHDKIDTKETEVNTNIKEGPGEKKPPKKKKEEKDEGKAEEMLDKMQNNSMKQQGGSATGEGGSAAAPKKNNKTEKNKTPSKTKGKLAKPAANPSVSAGTKQMPDVEDEYSNADPSKWKFSELKFAGSSSYEEVGKQEEVKGKSIPKGIEKFKANPGKYLAMMYQTASLEWPKEQHTYTYVHRAGTKAYKPQGLSASGWMTLLLHEYQQLPPLKDNILPKQHRDKYTDNMSHCGRKLHSKNNKPILPGRGMGIGDTPSLKVIGDVDPSDINQGSVGDCWLLSGISSLAEFDGAVKRLFRKTKNLDKMPLDDGPNIYT